MATETGSDELNDTAGGEHNRLKTLGKYRIQKRIGAGGMGTVFLAVDDSLNRTVALKVLPKDRAENPVLVRRFKAEGQAAAHLEHPNIVRVFEAGESKGFLYIALEYVEGIDVHELVERRGIVPVKRSADIIRQTTLALQHAHEKGIVHRDIKPSNLLIKRDGTVKLADLGLARSIDDTLETNITRAGTTVGTVDYMAPEQARNSKAADVRSDIYSLGCTWYQMLTGHPPFPVGSMTNKLQAHAVSKRPDPRSENGRVPEGVVAVIQRMMAPNPEARYQSPAELLEDLSATSKMHRSLDESVLAALADESADDEEAKEIHEPDLRQLDEIDAVDLAALKESGDFVVEESPRPRKPSKSRRSKGSKRLARRETRAETASPADPSDEEPSEFKVGKRRKKMPTQPAPSTTPDRSPGESTEEDRNELPQEQNSPGKATARKSQRPPKAAPVRSPKRGTVTTADGKAPPLPKKMDVLPEKGPANKSINLEALKYAIPAVIVVGALAAIIYAVMNSGDSLNSPEGANPYADESSEQEDGRPDVAQAQPDNEPSRADSPEVTLPEAPPRVEALPFPGAEDATQTAGGVRLIPDWVNSFRTPLKAAERTLIVRRRPLRSNDFGSLNEALQSLPRSGGTIELSGEGPFPLNPAEIENRGHVRIQATDGRHSVVHMTADDRWNSQPFLQFTRTNLELQGVHFVFPGEQIKEAVIFGIHDGSLHVRDCSLTTADDSPKRMIGFQMNGSAVRPNDNESGKCLFENVIIRGSSLTAISLVGPTADLVAGNCLFISGDAPALMLADRQAANATTGDADQIARGIRLLATSVVSEGSAIELNGQGNGSSVADCDIITRRTVLATSSEASPMVALHDWPMSEGELGGVRAAGLSWSADRSAFIGWNRLMSGTSSDGKPLWEVASAAEAWRKFWNQRLPTGAVIADAMPNPAVLETTPDRFQNALTALMPDETTGELPGCRPEEFSSLPQGLIEHVVAIASQPYEPDWLGAGLKTQGEPLRFDLNSRRSLSRFLTGDACPDGSHIIASGDGVKEIDTIVISEKSLRLELEPTGETPLILQPKPGRGGQPSDQPWITIRNGSLDLVNAHLKLPASLKAVYPNSAIQLEGASLSLRNSVLEGPRTKTDADVPLVRWTRGEGPGQNRAILVENCFLVGLSTLLSGPVHWQSVVLRNSVLASGTDAVSITAESAEQLPATLILDHCTIAATGAAIRVQIPPAAAASDSLTVFSRASVFAGPGEDASQANASAVFAHSGGAAKNRSVIWWGSANGFSPRLSGYRVDGPGSPGDFQRGWLSGWGDGHEVNPLTTATDVLFAAAIPHVKLIQAESFRLSDGATASTWGPMRESIGASVDEIGPHQLSAGSPSTSPQGRIQPGARSGKNNPGF